MNTIRVATLNLWRYYDWAARFPKICVAFAGLQPDVILLQEVQINEAFSPLSQSDQIAKRIGYSYSVFMPTMVKKNQIDQHGEHTAEATHGLAVLSKYPITKTQNVILKQDPADAEPRSIFFFSIEMGKKTVDFCNVHFSNNDLFAENHLKETLAICRTRQLAPIIAGDYNIFHLEEYKKALDGYRISSDELDYVSYPRDNGRLDYIAIPENYSFKQVICPEDAVSDHRIVAADIALI